MATKTTEADNFFRKKYTTTVAYAVGILLFFLPFMEIKCNSMTLYHAKGIDLVTGFEIENETNKMFGLPDSDATVKATSAQKVKSNPFAISAFIFGIVGLALSFANFSGRPTASMVTGVLAAVSLIALFIHARSEINDVKLDLPNDSNTPFKITAEVTVWFFFSLFSFLAAAFFSYKHRQLLQQPTTNATGLQQDDFFVATNDERIE